MADRGASGTAEVISKDLRFGYAIQEFRVSRAGGRRMLAAEPGTSLYCVQGRGWASLPGSSARYALEPGTTFALTTRAHGIIIDAVEDLTMLQIHSSRQ
jgi:hypothetical protein